MRNKNVDSLMGFLRANGKAPWVKYGGKHIKVYWMGRPGCTRMITCSMSPSRCDQDIHNRAQVRRYLRQDQTA